MRRVSSEANTASTEEAPIGRELRSLLLFSTVWAGVCVLVFLAASDFFTTWSGQAVSVRPSASPAPKVYEVLIAGKGRAIERTWPAEVVNELALPFDAVAVPPIPIPPERPHTSKVRYTLHFLVEGSDGSFDTIPTTSPRPLALAAVLFLLGVGIRNMTVSGSPLSIEPRGVLLPKAQAAVGAPADTVRGPPRKGPPPARRRRGPRR